VSTAQARFLGASLGVGRRAGPTNADGLGEEVVSEVHQLGVECSSS